MTRVTPKFSEGMVKIYSQIKSHGNTICIPEITY